jgi:CRP-like cAMP-binding protein
LFHEGEPANYIYIVINGEFKIMKKVHRQKFAFEQNTDAILKDPLKAKR